MVLSDVIWPMKLMRHTVLRYVFSAITCLVLSACSAASAADFAYPPMRVLQLTLEGPIGPASSDYIAHAFDYAVSSKATAVLLRLDTPGGLDSAMRAIVKHIIAAPLPVVTYVAPGGARAASAGVYILYASHIAAMASATNLGAATPVQLPMPGSLDEKKSRPPSNAQHPSLDQGSVMERKMTNDAVAYLRGLAHLRGRNADWAEKAVR
jgi:membrane-bound serine protease (ClpP class)